MKKKFRYNFQSTPPKAELPERQFAQNKTVLHCSSPFFTFTFMATNYFTDGRVRMLRLQAGFLRCHDIVKEFVKIKISEQLGLPCCDFPTTTWRRWCHENIAFIRRYRFWRNQAKEEDEGEEIPIFDKVDITFFSYLMRVIVQDCPGEAFR